MMQTSVDASAHHTGFHAAQLAEVRIAGLGLARGMRRQVGSAVVTGSAAGEYAEINRKERHTVNVSAVKKK